MGAFLFKLYVFLAISKATANQYPTLKLEALGRSFTLGALYNARTDQLVAPGVTLWDLDTLKKNLHTENHPHSEVRFSAGNSMDKKASLFNINDDLKMSFLAGLVEAEGAAAYLNKKLTSNYMAEVSFVYKTTTHFEQLTMNHLAADKIEHPLVLENEKEATHIVTKIVYGAAITLRVKKDMDHLPTTDQLEQVNGELNEALRLITGSTGGQRFLPLTREQRKNYARLVVIYNGDVRLKQPPTNFFDAMETFKILPSLITKTTAVPVEVYLIPLSRLDKNNSAAVRRVSAHLLRKTEKRLEKYDNIFRDIGDLKKTVAYHSLVSFKDHVNEFESALDLHRLELQRKLFHILPKIRGRGLEEVELTNVLDEASSSFTMNKLSQWTVFKKREAKILKHILSTEPEVIYTEPGKFDELLVNPEITFIVALKLKLYPHSDPYTACLADRCNASIQHRSWLTKELRKQLRDISVQYQRMQSRNMELLPRSDTAFAIVEEVLDDASTDVAIQIFEDGVEVEPDFKAPSVAITTTHRDCKETRMAWQTMENNTEPWLRGRFLVAYRQVGANQWITYRTTEANATFNFTTGNFSTFITKLSAA